MKIYITRHGQVLSKKDAIAGNVYYPSGDPPLSELGRHQAELLGKRLKSDGFKGQILASPFRRTTETAHIIAEMLNLSVKLCPEIREIVQVEGQMKNFKGRTLEELKEEFPTVEALQKINYPWWTQEVETREEVAIRVRPAFEKIISGNTDTLLVCHGAPGVAMVKTFLREYNLSYNTEGRHDWNCCLSIFKRDENSKDGNFDVETVYDVSHIPFDFITSNSRYLKDD